MAVDTAMGWVYTSPVLKQASGREMWSGSYLWPPSHMLLQQGHRFGRCTGYHKILQFNSNGFSRSCHVGLRGTGKAIGRRKAQPVSLPHCKHANTLANSELPASPSQAEKTHRAECYPLGISHIPRMPLDSRTYLSLTFLIGC